MPMSKNRMTKKQLKLLFIFLFAGMLLFGIGHIQRVVRSSHDDYSVIKRLGQTAAAVMHYDDLTHLSGVSEDTAKVQYHIIKQLLADIKDINPSAKFSYIYVVRNGKVFFMADSEPVGSPDYSPAGQELTEATALDRTLMNEGSVATIEFAKDRWGDWVSILVPLKHPDTGKIMAVFGMDFDAKALKAEQWKALLLESLLVLLTLFAMVLLYKVLSDSQKLKTEFLTLKKTEHELLLAKERAEESDRLKTSFLKNISHEIRTPMNSILGFADLLNEKNVSAEHRELFLSNMANSGQRLLNTISDIIELSRIQSRHIGTIYTRTNLEEQFFGIKEQFNLMAKEKDLEWICEILPEARKLVFYTDTEMLNSILKKLIWNAFKFTTKGFVKVGYEIQDSMLCFYVKDTGVGVDDQHKKFIFEFFRQGNESMNRSFEGTGTGLAIAKAYIDMMGGKIWLESELGVGSTFYFTIPYHKHEPDISH